MSDDGRASVVALYRYPVKGFSPEHLASVQLEVGGMFPHDRAYAVENGVGRFDADDPRHLSKINYLMLMRNERVATLRTRFDPADHTLTIYRQDRQVARGDLQTRLGRQMIEQFLGAYLKGDLRGAPRIVSAAGHHFADVPSRWLHLVNLASVRDLERISGRSIDPLRFRANVHIDGWPAWTESTLVGRELEIGGTRVKVVANTGRCEATNVDPQTAQRDMAIPALLQRNRGNDDFGVYCEVTAGGAIAVGDTVERIRDRAAATSSAG
jgi:hypothetical protein